METRVYGLNILSEQIAIWRQEKGFYTPPDIHIDTHADLMLGKLMLVVSEVSEAAEAVRKNEPLNFLEELADIMIRILDICGTMNLDIEQAIMTKMEINRTRPFRHGTLTSL